MALTRVEGAVVGKDLARQTATVATMKLLRGVKVGDVVETGAFSTGSGGGATYDVVLTSSINVNVRNNGRNIFESTANPLISFVERRTEGGSTYTEFEWYVDQTNGTDEWGYGVTASAGAYKTLQFAFDQLPDIIAHQQKINLSAGTFNQSSRPSASMPRPATFYPQGKYIGRRTAQDGADLGGMVIIKGVSAATTFIETNPTAGYEHGVYVTGTEVGLQDLSIVPAAVGTTKSLLTSHRSGYTHVRDCIIDGSAGTSNIGVVCEAGGWAELIATPITGSTLDVNVAQDSACSIALSGAIIGSVTATGFLQLATDVVVNGDLTLSTAGDIQITSSSGSNPVILNGNITLGQGDFSAVFAEINGAITARGTQVRLSSSGFQEAITLRGGSFRGDGSKSYVSPNTMSNSATPLILRDGAENITESTLELRNSSNALVGPDYGNQQVSPNANGFSIPINLEGRVTTMYVVGSGASRTGCTLADPSGLLAGTPPSDGAVLHMIGNGFNVEIVDGTNQQIVNTGTVTIGSLSGAYTGCTWVYNASSGKWLLSSVGVLIP
ncbi:MAG: hypothetical protein Unbinned6805contig1000_5 [Prokaryotic dsDNA virus sp.]|nr:MAG: hypothetical protein Unbinned6805contig1000_5 [Prokaryotic dsDNA virus sp.]|tara:strand:+ start:14280 stop:15941 length:1662 start_codon:yes stop_codon:yes gene_type:complete